MQASRRRASIHKRTLVSIICITYNHEQYIAQALDNFLSQKHDNFDLEVIVADDASEDRTQQIISKYASAFLRQYSRYYKRKMWAYRIIF